jgi:Transposase DDE domain
MMTALLLYAYCSGVYSWIARACRERVEAQIIVAYDVTQSGSDCAQLLPMTDAVEANLGRKPEQMSADAGYCSQENLAGLEDRNIDAYVATGRARDAVAGTAKDKAVPAPGKVGPATRVEAMRAKDQSRWIRQPLPAAQATPRAGVRADQTGARIPPIPVARLRQGARRVGTHLHRPQSSQTRPQAESVRRTAPGRRGNINWATGRNKATLCPPNPPSACSILANCDNLDSLLAPSRASCCRRAR